MIAALAPASLLLVDPAGWYPFGPVKWLAVPTIVLAGAAVVLARRPVRIAVAPTLAALALVGALVLGALFGADGLYAWIGTPERHLGVLVWVLALLAFVVGQSLEDRDRRVGRRRAGARRSRVGARWRGPKHWAGSQPCSTSTVG